MCASFRLHLCCGQVICEVVWSNLFEGLGPASRIWASQLQGAIRGPPEVLFYIMYIRTLSFSRYVGRVEYMAPLVLVDMALSKSPCWFQTNLFEGLGPASRSGPHNFGLSPLVSEGAIRGPLGWKNETSTGSTCNVATRRVCSPGPTPSGWFSAIDTSTRGGHYWEWRTIWLVTLNINN